MAQISFTTILAAFLSFPGTDFISDLLPMLFCCILVVTNQKPIGSMYGILIYICIMLLVIGIMVIVIIIIPIDPITFSENGNET